MSTTDHDLDQALRSLDAADHTLTPHQQARKDTLLQTLLTTSDLPGSAPTQQGPTPHPARPDNVVPLRRRAWRVGRWLVPVGAAAGLVLAFTLTNGTGGGGTAYASWTSEPSPVRGQDLARAEESCRETIADSLKHQGADVPEELRPITRPETARTVVAEKRGKYTFLSMVTDDGSSTQCFFDDGDLSHPVGMTGSGVTATSPPPRELAPDEIEMNGQGMSGGPEGSYAFTDGRAGADVTGVTIHSGGTTVQATVSNGHYAAWWPAELPENPNAVEPRISFEVTLADGTVKEPTMPEWYGPDAAPDGVARVSTGGGVGEDGQEVSTVSGELGADVTAVALVVGGREVPATVTDGTFVVELPGTLEGAEPTLRLTLRDGTVREEPLPTTAGTEVSAQHAD